ncbi:MAG TPA: site-2 protease family protein [Longimicrobiales bacterium]|nr:site-2 protease family protein [Longimicrobiales bacterium]
MNPDVFLFLPVLLFSVVLHEFAHGWVALREGDNTALMLGRLTLNPIPHIDLFGSIIFPLILWLSQTGIVFGWAKPVPINPRNFRNYKRGDILVSLAGITANLLLAGVLTLFVILLVHLSRWVPALGPTLDVLRNMAGYGIIINLVLAFFNLIPIPPLDGSHVLYHMLPPRVGLRYRELGRYGMFILLALMIFARNLFQVLLWPVFVLQNLAEALIRLWT